MPERKAYDIGLDPAAHSHLMVLQSVLAQVVNHLNLSKDVITELQASQLPRISYTREGERITHSPPSETQHLDQLAIKSFVGLLDTSSDSAS